MASQARIVEPKQCSSLGQNTEGEIREAKTILKFDGDSGESTQGVGRERAGREKEVVGSYLVETPNGLRETVEVTLSDLEDESSEGSDESDVEDMVKSINQGRFWYIVRPLYCHHNRSLIKCPCMYQMKMGKKYYYDNRMLDDLTAIAHEIRMAQFALLQGRDVKNIYQKHRAVIVALTTKDKNLLCDPKMDRSKFLAFLYEVREGYGYNQDFGQRNMVSDTIFEAQGFTDVFQSIFETASSYLSKSAKTVSDLVKEIFDKILKALRGVFGVFAETLGKAVESIMSSIRSWVVKQFNPSMFIKDCIKNIDFSKTITLLCIIAVVIVVDIIGILSYRLCTTVIDKLIKLKTQSYQSEGPADPVAGLVTLIGLTLGLCAYDMSTLAKRAREFTSLVTAGLSSSFLLASLFLVLPLTIQTALKMKFGTRETKEQVLVEDWLIRSSAVIRLKKIPKVLISEEYYQWLSELHKEAMGMKGKIKTSTIGNIFVRNLVSIAQILSLLDNYRTEKASKDLPYSLHICGPPGYGKTLLTTKFVKDLFLVEDRDIYQVPVASEFWDAYIGQSVIIMDEFLVGDNDSQVKSAKEYLELVSTKNFKPNLASVDDPAVGIKGTCCVPIGVITINNTAYNRVSAIPQDAIWRRREYVIELNISEKYKDRFKNGKIDLTDSTDEEIKELSWLRFTLKSPSPTKGTDIPGLTYGALVDYLRTHRQKQVEMTKRIHDGITSDILLDKTPKEMLDDIIRELRGVPSEPQGLGDAIFGFFENIGFQSEGPQDPNSDTKSNESTSDRMDDAVWRGPSTGSVFRTEYNKLKKAKPSFSKEKLSNMLSSSYERALHLSQNGETEELRNEAQRMKEYVIRRSIKLGACISGFESEEDGFDTASENGIEQPLSQKQNPTGHMVISTIDHSNVDQTQQHRHICLGTYEEPILNEKGNSEVHHLNSYIPKQRVTCGKQFSHAHSESTHPMLCGTCINNKREESYDLIHGGGGYATYNKELLPEDMYYEYIGSSEDYAKQLDKLWTDICLSKFLSHGTTPIVIINDPSFNDGQGLYYEIPSAQAQLGTQFMTVTKWTALFVVIYAVRKWFTKDKSMPEEVCFGQSPPPDKERRSGRRSKSWKYYHQTDDKTETCLQYNGLDFKICPIRDSTFLTYYHALLDENGELVPDGTNMKVRYAGNTDSFQFCRSMIRVCEDSQDVVFMTYPRKRNSQFPNNVKKFWSLSDAEDFATARALIEIDGRPQYIQANLATNKSYACKGKRIEMDECLQYKCPTRKGDCGSLIISTGPRFPNKIVGIHVAGGSDGKAFYGLAVMIFKEDVEAAIQGVKEECSGDIEFTQEGPNYVMERIDKSGPNLLKIEPVPLTEQVYLPRFTKLKKSSLSCNLSTTPKKNLPLMSMSDARCHGEDPIINMLNDSLSVGHTLVDQEIVDELREACLSDLKNTLVWPVGKRRLTIEEAIGGIPGKLASMKIKTSAGYPLCKVSRRKGKADYFSFNNAGELVIEPYFREMVEETLNQLLNQGIDPRRFIAFLKDELISSSKVLEKRSRIIYAGDLVSNVAYRMVFGHILVAFNNSYMTTGSAIGLNQYSWDMQIIYDYLVQVGKNFVAGDFKNFDKRVHPQFQAAAYRILMDLCDSETVPNIAKESFVYQQCFSAAQVLDALIQFKTTHFSGCFFTSIVNNIVNELYIRYCFYKVCPNEVFHDHVRIKVLGDDHIYCFSDKVAENCRPWVIREIMSELGQVYTSDRKNEELTNEFRDFKDITFLGAHPVEFGGKWAGALKKETLEETLHWTRNNDLTILQECKTVMELSSLWGIDYYTKMCNEINYALKCIDIEPIYVTAWKETARMVCARTAGSGKEFPYGFSAQGPGVTSGKLRVDDHGIQPITTEITNSLAKLNEDKKSEAVLVGVRDPMKLAKKAVNEESMALNYGTSSNVYRHEFKWTNNQSPLSGSIAEFDVPFGILGFGDPQNLQNMPFDRFAYWKGDVALHFQINATPFQQGLAAAYFMPLARYESELANITTNSYVFIQPDQNSTYTIRIPFKYLRSVMNTIARDTESLGTVYFTPLSPLKGISVDEVTVTVYSSFPDSEFTIPRPVDIQERRRTKFYTSFGEAVSFEDSHIEYEAQGNSASTNVTYNISNTGGDMPIQKIGGGSENSATQSVDANLEATIPMPLDNPPLCSGAIPVEQAFPGMSSAHGVRPTRDMQLKPTAFSRQQMEIFNPMETKIETLLSKMCLLTRFEVTPSLAPGTELFHINLNTRLGVAEGTGIPLNIAVLNQFLFWRADFEFTFIAVQTQYHSMRLRAITQYAAPQVVTGTANTTYSSIMNFASNDKGSNYVHKELVRYNAQTEFLRTYQGEGVIDPVQNYSIGSFSVDIANALIAPDTVDPTVEVLVFLRILNPKVAVPSPASPFTWNDYLKYEPTPTWVLRSSRASSNNLERLERVSNIISRVPKASITWVGAVPANGTYYPSNLQGAGFKFIFQDNLISQRFEFIPETLSINVTNAFLEFVTESFSIPFTPSVSGSVAVIGSSSMAFQADPPIEFQAEGPEEDTSNLRTTEDVDHMDATSVTKDEAPHRENEVCKLEIGEKFEFCVSDIHEIARRYIRMTPITNPALDQFAVYSVNTGDQTQYNLNIPTQPQTHWRALFAAWAGSVKFRIFRNRQNGFPQVFFTPFYNQSVTTPSIPIIDAVSGVGFVYDGVSIVTDTAISGPIAREMMYPIGEATYIDVSTPFQSHYNFCYNSQTQEIAPISSGTLTLSSPTLDIPNIYTAFGDDLRLGIFRAPRLTTFDMTVFTNGVGGFFQRPTIVTDWRDAHEQSTKQPDSLLSSELGMSESRLFINIKGSSSRG
ncbi:hypothetical protein [Hubei tetragnatha maxillosa virus 1]|uniref:hypothetical protein n=1 Tax=Hubei tetragnatha maxillosa virus 1 TaxID=1923243 RepID=UPI00090CC66F|nr:hypothetical protein [Hubei tetragnatha maxillosa virus 1]APG76671.1 hypothetical protein [Hubei tetragnatha maxillosa virus 1]APG77445.1 hypothetical protein [Hubei tetragnatha maxillosa virus 1]